MQNYKHHTVLWIQDLWSRTGLIYFSAVIKIKGKHEGMYSLKEWDSFSLGFLLLLEKIYYNQTFESLNRAMLCTWEKVSVHRRQAPIYALNLLKISMEHFYLNSSPPVPFISPFSSRNPTPKKQKPSLTFMETGQFPKLSILFHCLRTAAISRGWR